ncbi:MAG: translation elongation factor Ts [Patescibacteria group bacterium]|nr:translation elongation factor Ts [Patescibacteria group bacterium]MCL5224235.1 translation elongation factor Ts [Patescibacteria group bacterium]
MVKATDIQKLREETGAGVMDCKRALTEADGDFDKAKEFIKAQGLAKADKKSERTVGAGIVTSYIHNDRVGVLLEIRCETDFVCKSDPFRELAKNIAMQIAAMEPQNVEELLQQPFIRDQKTLVADVIKGVIAKVGENIVVERFVRFGV